MQAIFLCGGVGKRMFPIAEDKILLSFLGKSLLQHQIEAAKQAGMKHFLVIGNAANMKRIERIAGTVSGVEIELALQQQPLGIANALQSAASSLHGDILVLNPNDIFAVSAYTSLFQEAQKKSAASYILGCPTKSYFPGGYLVVNSANELKNIVEKPKPGQEPSNLVNILAHLHTDPKRLLDYMERVKTSKDDVYECALDQMAGDGYKIKVIPYDDFWAPIKYPWHIFDAVKYFLDLSQPEISPSASISEKATIQGTVVIADNVRVLENAVIRGPVYIGPDSVIGNNTLVREYSHIGADCVIGYSTEIKNSYVGDGCWTHSSYIGDSIVGKNCSFGAGTILSNLRFDEQNISVKVGTDVINAGRNKLGAIIGDNCRTGVNVSIMPGIKIGPDSVVGPHVCLTKDLEPQKKILLKPHDITIPNHVTLKETKTGQLKEKLEKSE